MGASVPALIGWPRAIKNVFLGVRVAGLCKEREPYEQRPEVRPKRTSKLETLRTHSRTSKLATLEAHSRTSGLRCGWGDDQDPCMLL